MTVETINNGIEDLDPTLPAGTDPVSEGDNHVRNIKTALDLSFPNTAGAWNTTSEIQASGFNSKNVRIRNVGTPVDATDAAQKGQIDALQTQVDGNDTDITALQQNDAVQDAAIADHETRIGNLEAQAATFQSFGNYDGVNDTLLGGSGDFSIAKTGTGVYEITFNEAATSQYSQSLTASNVGVFNLGADVFYVIPVSTTLWQVTCYANNGNPTDTNLSFIRVAD